MKTKEEVIKKLLNFSGVYLDYPFGDAEWAVLRHTQNKKSYALIFERQNNVWINVKLEPTFSHMIKETYSSVVPAYHMNKEHWVSIIADGSMTDDEIYSLVSVSYDLTNVKEPKSRKKQNNGRL